MSPHQTTRFRKLNGGEGADVDVQVAPIVASLNNLGAETISSCQGDPGPIADGGRYGHVAFVIPGDEGWFQLCELVFKHLTPMYAHMYDDVILEVHSDDKHFEGWLRFRNEAIDEITKRLGCWVEMLHK